MTSQAAKRVLVVAGICHIQLLRARLRYRPQGWETALELGQPRREVALRFPKILIKLPIFV